MINGVLLGLPDFQNRKTGTDRQENFNFNKKSIF